MIILRKKKINYDRKEKKTVGSEYSQLIMHTLLVFEVQTTDCETYLYVNIHKSSSHSLKILVLWKKEIMKTEENIFVTFF